MAVCALADRLSRREQIFYGVERVDGVVAPEVIDIIDQLFPVATPTYSITRCVNNK